ncbi:MAG: ArsS family sensor histidine kinase [Campylobacterota bacterium]|nr:ArsS family sensor histidine kinase [Campylobacterota bacterium]
MRRNAVLLTIIFAFVITFLSVGFAFWEFYKLNRIQYINNIFMKYEVITRIFREHFQERTSLAMLEANLAVYDLDLIHQEEAAMSILKEAKVLKREGFKAVNEIQFFDRSKMFRQQRVEDMRATMLQLGHTIYFYIESPRRAVMLKDTRLKPYTHWNLLSAFIGIVSMLMIMFVLILQRIRPLRLLRRRIAAFGAGNLDVSFAIKGREDEIALVANELEDTRKKIRTLLESRTLFLRNIMHELKTPIAKGRIASQMLDSEKQKTRFNTIFERMEFLINEFALIEEVTSGSEHLERKEFRLLDLIDGAIDLAMIEHDAVDIQIDTAYKLDADYQLFATAIKNLIDNALKYSPDQKVTIGTDGGEIWFDNIGEPLSHPLAYYVEPFTKEHPSKNSFGLGLYLVDSILKHHGMVLAYEHRDGINRFIFVPEK